MGLEPASRHGRWRVRRFDTVDSTNRWLLNQARGGARQGLVVVADHQSAGRGRRGREWSAPPGSSLLMSVLLRPRLDATRVHVLTMAASIALSTAVERVTGVRAAVKWPNDVVVADRKLAGLLAETVLSPSGAVGAVVIGVGCNVEWRDVRWELPEGATACDLEAGAPVETAALLDAFLDGLGERLDDLDGVPDAYRGALATLGRRVQVDLGSRDLSGTAVDVDDAGRLVVAHDDGRTETVAVGDVVHLRGEGVRGRGSSRPGA